MRYQKLILLSFIIGCLVILSACWDQRLLREQSLILAIGYDKGENNTLKKTVTYPKKGEGNSENSEENLSAQGSNTLSMTGHTVKDAEEKMDKVITEKFDRSKARVIIFGKNLAEAGIFSTLDSVYRDLRGPLYANVAIFDGEAEDALNIKSDQAAITSDIYADLLNSAAEAGITQNKNVQNAAPILLAKGKDLALPHLSIDEAKKDVVVKGLALFHQDKMVGTLNIDQSTMFLLLSDNNAKYTSFNFKVDENEKDPYKQFVNFKIQKNSRKIDIIPTNGDIHAKIEMNLEIDIDEYAADDLADKNKIKKLRSKIENDLNELAEETIAITQEVNSDVLGLGSKVKAYHHEVWKNIDWVEVYKEMNIDIDFSVQIIRHGILN